MDFSSWVLGLAAIWVFMTLVWLVSVRLVNASIVDNVWGLGFVLVVWIYLASAETLAPSAATAELRRWLVAALVTVWGVRLSLHIGWRNRAKPEDYRYQAFRQTYGAERYWWFSYFQVFLLQGGLLWLISLPLLGVMSGVRPLSWLDGVASAVWLIGFLFESIGDWQLARFKADPANKGKLMQSGLWRFTRHPNYFGDAAVWWGYGLFCMAAGFWWPVVGSLVMTFLLVRVSGVALLERGLAETKPGYADYVRRTSAFFPLPPKS